MGKLIKGNLIGTGKKFAIIVSRFNEFISSKLLDGAVDCLHRHNVKEEDIDVVWVPGSFEIPLTAKKLSENKKYDAVICLGVIIRGETPHFDFIAGQTTKCILEVSLSSGKPVSYGIITADSTEQATERAGLKLGNRGEQAALTALEMVNLIKQI